MKFLIVNADDLGKDPGILRAVSELVDLGVVSSVSCMTSMSSWPQAAAFLRDHPEVGAGVHLNFNDGKPLLPTSQVPSLVGDDGFFLSDQQILRSFRRGTTDQLRAEFMAQIDRYVLDTGRQPDHLDNHCTVSYIRPDRFRVTVDLAREYHLPIRAPFGNDLGSRYKELADQTGRPALFLYLLGLYYRHLVDRHGIPRPQTFLPSFSRDGQRHASHLLHLANGLRDGWVSELLTHPGYDKGWREQEVRALGDPLVYDRLRQPDIQLVSFGALLTLSDL